MFDRTYYINLDRSTERRRRFEAAVAAVDDWPFPAPERWPGVCENPPCRWDSGREAWSVFRSHMGILTKSLFHGVQSVLIFEDDVVFCEDLGERVRDFLAAVPDDWDAIYFGGCHYYLPEAVNAKVLRGRGINGGWAYAVRRRAMAQMFELLARFWPAMQDKDGGHIDIAWNTLHRHRRVRAYSPWHWLCGHGVGRSERTGENWDAEQWFNLTEPDRHRVWEECQC